MTTTNLHLLWRDRSPLRRFRTGVSLHSHTLHSHESMGFVPRYTAGVPLLAPAIRQQERRYAARTGRDLSTLTFHQGLDPTRAYEGTDTRAGGLLVGAALAIAWPTRRVPARPGPPRPGASAVALDACGTFSHHKREAGLARLTTLGIEVSDYATLMVEILRDNARPEAAEVYAAMDMPWAKLVGSVLLLSASCAAFGFGTSWRPIADSLPAGGVVGGILADRRAGDHSIRIDSESRGGASGHGSS